MITVEIKDDALAAPLMRLHGELGDMTKVMNDIGGFLVRSTKDRTTAGTTPDGTPFAPRSPVTIERYKKAKLPYAGVLRQSGDMVSDIFHTYSPDSVQVGSNAVQAAVMQWGAEKGAFGAFIGKDKLGRDHFHSIPWGDIPARPYLGISDTDRTGILEIVGEWLEGAALGGR